MKKAKPPESEKPVPSQAALEQEGGNAALALVFFAVQVSRQSSEKDEHGGTQMSECPAEKQCRFGCLDPHRVSYLAMQEERLSHVVQEHEYDHESPEGIDGQQTLVQARSGRNVNRYRHRKSQAGSELLCQTTLTAIYCNHIT